MKKLDWRAAKSSDREGVESLLKGREGAWVSLIDRYWAAGIDWCADFSVLEDPSCPGYFPACFFLNVHGLAILAVKPSYRGPLCESRLILASRRRMLALFCLMGPSEALEIIKSAIKRPTLASTHYHLMEILNPRGSMPEESVDLVVWPPAAASTSMLWRGLDIERSKPAHAALLIDLQIRYELEEVLVNGHRFDPDLSRKNLDLSLARQCIWHAASGTHGVAKAGTNGRSWRFAQIGGVFTQPDWRNKGIGRQLMQAVLQDIFSAGLHASLFVKQSNAPAVRLYENLGFSISGPLTISYY